MRQGLLKASWGTSENNRRAKFYELTAAGRKRLREETDNWNRLVDRHRLPRLPRNRRKYETPRLASLPLAALFQRSQMNAEMEEELRSHIQHRADDLERSGLDRAEAERRARIEFGGHERFKEECHEALGGNFIETLVQDVRFSLRVLRKSPGFTVVAVLTLALAIGANAVVFGVLNALILRPLNVPQAESLYGIERGNDKAVNQSYPDYLDLRDRNRSFDGLAAYNIAQAGLDTGDNPSRAWVYEVSGNYFDVLGIQPYLGRFFHASDEHGPNSAPYIVLTYAYWHTHFQDDRGVVGRVVQLNKHPFTILGVAPPEFHGTLLFFFPDFFVPMVNQEQVEGVNVLNARGNRWVFDGDGTSEGGSHSGTGDCRSELDWRVSGKDLSQRRWPDDLCLGASKSYWRLSWAVRCGHSLRD